MHPDWDSFRDWSITKDNPNIARRRALDKFGWVPGLIVLVLILALIFGW